MKLPEKKRAYHMAARAEKVALNDKRIMDATIELWLETSLLELTLENIALRSGVTVRTILRKFGSREGLLKACIDNMGDRLTQKRLQAKPGNLDEIVDILLEEYEHMGDALTRTLTVEYEFPSTHEMLKKARKIHRDWCALVFEPYLPSKLSGKYEMVLSAFITGTEFYLWKLLRKDLGKSQKECRQIFLFSLESLAANSRNQKKQKDEK
jgi:AcrR family transcriptional regulator